MTEKNKARAQDPARGLASYIKRGGSIAYPPEPCYGLGCDPRNPWALKQLTRLKGRNADHYKHLQPYAGAGLARVSASAHQSGKKSAKTTAACRRIFGSMVQVLAGSIDPRRRPSSLIDLATGTILRP